MLLYLEIAIVLFGVLLGLFLWYTRVYKKSVWYNIKLLFKVYDAACQDLVIVKKGESEFAVCNTETINGIFVGAGFCNALQRMYHVDYSTKHKILAILGKEITKEDLYWKVQLEQISESSLIDQLSSINARGNSGIYWFYMGDVLSRRDFLYKVMKKHGKIK